MEVGSLQIGGSINTQTIESGLARVEGGLKNVSAIGDSVNADFVRIDQSTKALGKNLKIMAVAGVTAIIGIAKGAPAVAGAMANMKISFGKLTRELGESLSPAFNRVSEAFSGFVGWVQEHGPTISAFAIDVIDGLSLAVSSLADAWGEISSMSIPFLDIKIGDGLKWLISTFGAEMVGGLVAKAFLGPVAGVAAAGVISVGKSESEGYGGASVGALTGASLGTMVTPGIGTAIGFGIGALIGRGIDLFMGNKDRKASSLDLEYST